MLSSSLLGTAPPAFRTFPMFAHQGGWDEVLLVAVPLTVIGLLLWIANRRVNSQLAETAKATHHTDADEATDTPTP